MKDDEKLVSGVVQKAAMLEKNADVNDDDMRKINKLALSPLTADEVFTFKVIVGDNGLDDRNYEPFNLAALRDMKELYIGKTVIKDHSRRADNQIARIYDSELITSDKMVETGEPFTQLMLKCYMLKTASNADLIAEIKAGIKKEVSTGTRAKKAICSICGEDNAKNYCSHIWGRTYRKSDGTDAICYFMLDGIKEAYELSLVAVPAQVRAGTVKSKNYADEGTVMDENDTHKNEKNKNVDIDKNDESNDFDVRVKLIDSFLFTNSKEEDEDE